MRKTYGIILRLISQICIIALVSSLWFAACTKPETEQSGDRAIPVTSISLNKTTHSMTEGDSFRLIATIYPEDATNQNISWSSDSPQVATVDDAGLVLARQAGIATISVHTEDGNKTASCQFTIAAQVMPSVTIGASNISAVSAVLSGKANLGNSSSADLKMGIMYSKSSGVLPSTSTLVEATDIEAEYYYSVSITGLDPETTYYYRSYLNANGKDSYGDIKSFTTKDVSSLITTLEANVINYTEAIANAMLNLTDCVYTSIYYGFYFGYDAQHLDSFFKCDVVDDSNIFSYHFKKLIPETCYWYQAAIIIDGKEFLGASLSYTTAEVDLRTMPASNITWTTATLNGSISVKATDSLKTHIYFYYSETEKTREELINGFSNLRLRTLTKLQADGSFKRDITGLYPETTYYYIPIAYVGKSPEPYVGDEITGKVGMVSSFKTEASPEVIDLGLSVKWRAWNLGASKPEEYGDYYAWAETKTKTDYCWLSYKWGSSKYNTSDNKSEYKDDNYEDDPARVNLAGTWRTPTSEEWTELRTKCSCKKIKNYIGTSIYGIICTSNIPGYSHHWIFLPAAGWMSGTTNNGVNFDGHYWTSTCTLGTTNAFYLSLNNGSQYTSRSEGLSVRPVTE